MKNEHSVYGFPFVAKKKRAAFEKGYSSELSGYNTTASDVTYTEVPGSLFSNIRIALATALLSWLGVLTMLRAAWHRHHFDFSLEEDSNESDLVEDPVDPVQASPPVATVTRPKPIQPQAIASHSKRGVMSFGATLIGWSGLLLCLYVGASVAISLAKSASLFKTESRWILLSMGAVSGLALLLELVGRILCAMTPIRKERLLCVSALVLMLLVAAFASANVWLSLTGTAEGARVDASYQFGIIAMQILTTIVAIAFWFVSVNFAAKVGEHLGRSKVLELADKARANFIAAVVALPVSFILVFVIGYFIASMGEVSSRGGYILATTSGVRFIVAAIIINAIGSHASLYFQLGLSLDPSAKS